MKAAAGRMRPATERDAALYRETLVAEQDALALETECAALRVLLGRLLGRRLTAGERSALQGGGVPEVLDEMVRGALARQARRLSRDDVSEMVRTTMSAPREV